MSNETEVLEQMVPVDGTVETGIPEGAPEPLTEEPVLPPKEGISLLIDQAIEELKGSLIGGPSLERSIEFKLYGSYIEAKVDGIFKAISLGDFKEILDQILKIESGSLPAFILPPGTFHFAVTETAIQISCYYPESDRELRHVGTSRVYKVKFPNTIISHKLSKDKKQWKVVYTKYFSTSKSVFQLGDSFITTTDTSKGIYLLPVPNMYDNGNMCYGGNTMPILHSQNLSGLNYYYDVIFASPFNNDLGVKAVRSGDSRGWLEEWSKETSCPYNRFRG